MSRRFIAQAKYTDFGWFAFVYVEGASDHYWRGARFTRPGAKFAAWRKARKYNRLEAKGLVE